MRGGDEPSRSRKWTNKRSGASCGGECPRPPNRKFKKVKAMRRPFFLRDCVQLWGFIRRTHLTHIYGDDDPMVQVNIHEQETRYAELKQGDREFLSTFKLRFDNQVKANIGAGVAEITEPKRALDFVCKLDPKRYRSMLAKMRNSALNMEEGAYP